MKYLVKHWINVDMIAEEVIDGKDVDLKTNNIIMYTSHEHWTQCIMPFRILAPDPGRNSIDK